MIFKALIEPIQLALKIKVDVFLISLFEHVLYSIFYIWRYTKLSKLKFCVKHGWDQFFYQGSGIKILGKKGLRDQNNGKKIGIGGFRIYHVTTLIQACKKLMYAPRGWASGFIIHPLTRFDTHCIQDGHR